MKFKKRPIVVEAEQWFPGKHVPGVVWGHVPGYVPDVPYINTLEGKMLVSSGDWIITGVEGEKYACKDSVFRASYDLVVEEIVLL